MPAETPRTIFVDMSTDLYEDDAEEEGDPMVDLHPDEDMWMVFDSGDDWDDEHQLETPDAEHAVVERADHYKALGYLVVIRRNGAVETTP